MAAIDKYVPVALQVGAGLIASFDPGSLRLSPALARELYRDGTYQPSQAVVLTGEPITEFSTPHIGLVSALTNLGAGEALTLFFAKLDDEGGQTTTYRSISCTKGMLEPVTLSAEKGRRASLSVRVHHLSSDGDTVPFTVGTNAPSGQVMYPGFMLGPLTVGTALAGVQSLTFNFGYNVMKDTGENGKPFPIKCYAPTQEAVLNATLHDLAFASADRMHKGSIETTVTAAFRLLSNAAALPVDTGGYLLTVAKAAVLIDTIGGDENSSTAEITASLLQNSGYYTMAEVSGS